ncbi:MAG: DNA-directed RNA polymerase subunit beta'', partial [Bacteroidota bacterium]
VKGAKKAQSLTVPIGFEVKVKDGETVAAGAEVKVETNQKVKEKDVLAETRLVSKPSKLGFIPEERIAINKDISLLNEGYTTGSIVEAGEEVVKDVTVKTNGVLQVMVDNNIIREVIVYAGERHEVPRDLELAVQDEQYIQPGTTIAPGVVAKEGGVIKVLDLEEAENRIVIVRSAQVIEILPEEKGIPYMASTEDIGLKFFTRILVKDGEKVKAGAALAKTEAVIKLTGRLANLAGRLEMQNGCPAVTILETLSLRRDVPMLARRTELREQYTPTYLLVGDGEVIEPGTTIVRTEILAHTNGVIDRGNPLEENRRLLLITEEQEVRVPAGELSVEEGAMVHEGTAIAEGVAAPATGKVRKEGKEAVIRLARPYLISAGTQLLSDAGSMVVRGEPLATLIYDRVKTGDIIQGLPRVEELLEARKPKEFALIAEQGGTVRLISEPEEASKVFIVTEHGEEEYQLPPGSRLIVNNGEKIEAGDLLTDGPVNPHDVLRIQGVEAVQRYLVNEVQMVYRSQGVEIADKHIEVIVRQMTRKMKVDDSGESILLPGELVDVLDVNSAVNDVTEAGGVPPVVHPILLGITKASLNTESWVSAASFQETTRVLTEAAIEGKRDLLRGLKENVVIGRLIPAGTGFFDAGEEKEEPAMITASQPEIIGE